MKTNIILFVILLLFYGCAKEPKILFSDLSETYLVESSFSELPEVEDDNFTEVLKNFTNSCQANKTKKLYADLCSQASSVVDAKGFILKNFTPYQIYNEDESDTGMLTGYYEPLIHASLVETERYPYPLYETPKDLISVDLSSLYPELQHYRLRGRLDGNKLIPYPSRQEIKKGDVNASVICYCDSKIDRFFLEVQGSGKVLLDDNATMFVGYANQNGHKYKSIGKYLVKNGNIALENISLQSIVKWLDAHPQKIDEVLNYNDAMVFFQKRNQGATGALGLELTPKRSVAVDRKYIPLGSMLFVNAVDKSTNIKKIVFAQDTGGAIKGATRADYFAGRGKEALKVAGSLKAPLKLWILLPKNKRK
uniref:murein transglycosylase A n=1 Tax=Sulfurimonas sp. TaxID=2022749 RepID=UPI002612EA8E